MVYKLIIIEKSQIALLYFKNKLISLIMEHTLYRVNDIYLGKISSVLSSLDAAFVILNPVSKNGFISFNHFRDGLNFDCPTMSTNKNILAQIIREPTGTKGPTLSCDINLLGKYMVILPFSKSIQTSKKVEIESNKETQEISEDWLNEFENLARLKSSEDMKLVFGKILSGEIIKPGSFSIKTIKLISQLDNQAAKLFQIFCSQAISLRAAGNIFDARVVSFSGSAASNSLNPFGLSFDSLNVLHEYGLIISDYNSYMHYSACIANKQKQVGGILHFQNKNFGLVPSDEVKYDKTLQLHGVALTKAGKELMDIIPLTHADNYKDALIKFLETKHLELVEIE